MSDIHSVSRNSPYFFKTTLEMSSGKSTKVISFIGKFITDLNCHAHFVLFLIAELRRTLKLTSLVVFKY